MKSRKYNELEPVCTLHEDRNHNSNETAFLKLIALYKDKSSIFPKINQHK